MDPVMFIYAAIAIDIGLCIKWYNDDKREAEQERQEALHRAEAKERLAQTQARIDEIDKQIAATKAERERLERQYMPRLKVQVIAPFRHRYKVAGVTFKNADGTLRQEILNAIVNHEPPYEECRVSLDEYDYEGERALAVKVNGDQIGNIARKNLEEVFRDLDSAEEIELKVYGGDNGKYYGASITLVAKADDLDDEDSDDDNDLDDDSDDDDFWRQ